MLWVVWGLVGLVVLFVALIVYTWFATVPDNDPFLPPVARSFSRHAPGVEFIRCSRDLKRTKVRNYFVYHALWQRVEYR
jgi:hypothetical protein